MSQDDYIFDLPNEAVVNALGTNYNTVIRASMVTNIKQHIEYHKRQLEYYETMLDRIENGISREPDSPAPPPPALSPTSQQQPVKLSELAKTKSPRSQ